METLHFGLHIVKNNRFDAQDVAARLFLCPRISPEHASRMLDMLIGGTLSIDAFISKTDSYIKELSRQKEIDEDISHIMNNKLEAWGKVFKSPCAKDYKYLEKTFGFSKDDLFGNLANETVKETTKDRMTSAKSAKELASFVKQYIKGQDEAIDKLAVQFFLHLDSKRKQYTSKIKCPSVTIDPTGSGKSAIFRAFAKFCDCPIIRINLSSVQPEGWRGSHITDYFAHEIRSGVSVKDLEYAIIIFHEFDKITHYGCNITSDKGNDGDADMMKDIMRLFEEDDYLFIDTGIDPQTMKPATYKIPVNNFLIMFDGCYQGIEGIVKRRLNIGRTIGFSQPQKDQYDGINLQTLIKVEDLQEWGYSQELTGRIGNVVVINPLTTDAIYAIMTSAKDNILQSHIDTFSQSNIDLKFSEDALLYIANEAHKSGLGFRNVKALLAAALNRLYFDMPECADSEKKLVISISKDYVMQNINVKQL